MISSAGGNAEISSLASIATIPYGEKCVLYPENHQRRLRLS